MIRLHIHCIGFFGLISLLIFVIPLLHQCPPFLRFGVCYSLLWSPLFLQAPLFALSLSHIVCSLSVISLSFLGVNPTTSIPSFYSLSSLLSLSLSSLFSRSLPGRLSVCASLPLYKQNTHAIHSTSQNHKYTLHTHMYTRIQYSTPQPFLPFILCIFYLGGSERSPKSCIVGLFYLPNHWSEDGRIKNLTTSISHSHTDTHATHTLNIHTQKHIILSFPSPFFFLTFFCSLLLFVCYLSA